MTQPLNEFVRNFALIALPEWSLQLLAIFAAIVFAIRMAVSMREGLEQLFGRMDWRAIGEWLRTWAANNLPQPGPPIKGWVKVEKYVFYTLAGSFIVISLYLAIGLFHAPIFETRHLLCLPFAAVMMLFFGYYKRLGDKAQERANLL